MSGGSIRLALVTMGTLGDLHPMLGLGKAMVARGHHVTLMCNPVFEGRVRAQALEFLPVGTEADQARTLAHPKLWHPVDGLGVMWRYLLRPALRPTLDAIQQWRLAMPPGTRSLVVATPVAMGARLAQEAWGVPLVSTYTAATLLRTQTTPMTLARWRLGGAVPGWVPGLAWRALDRWKLQPLVLPALNAVRQELGLSPLIRSVFGDWMHGETGGLALFPPWFAPAAPDWPGGVQQGDFPLFDDLMPLDATLEGFLDRGAPPVVVMPGTGQLHGADVFRVALRALPALGLRGVFLGPVPSDVASQAARADIWCGAHQSFARLLPHARALVHHAGVGSSAQALRAGIAQLVWPQAYDQHDNAWRLEHLGVARKLPSSLAARGDALQRGLAQLLSSGAPERARALAAERFSGHAPDLSNLCRHLERWA